MVTNSRKVNWFDEELHHFYEHNNDGFIYGVYTYGDDEDFPCDVAWFKTETEQQNYLNNF